jgi:hypothetical protein
MRVTLGTFTRLSIEAQLGADLAETVETAVHHYAGKVKSGRPPIRPPQFLSTDTSPDFGTGTGTSTSTDRELKELDLTLDCETEAVLRREAIRYGTDVDAIAAHSVMVYLAELDFLSAASHPA